MALTGLTPIQITNLNVSGIATFEQAVGVGGTLTYQDVTNVDAVGIITARVGVNVPAGQLDIGSNIKLGNAGVITATDFKKADGSSVGGTQVTIGVRSGAAVTFAATGSSFNVLNRAGGNVAINL